VSEYDAVKFRELTRAEVEIRLREIEEELRNLRLRASMKQENNPLKIRHMRRAVARIKTLLHEDERGIRRLATRKESTA